MEDINNSKINFLDLKKRMISGIVSLTFRRLTLQAISFISLNIILARILNPQVLGIFNIGASIIAFFAFFSDIGLAASIIQKKEKITRDDLKTAFTIQQSLVTIIVLIVFFFAPQMAQWYQFDQSGVWLIRALAISFFFSSLKVIPSVLLERDLRFNPLIMVEIIETLLFNGILIFMVFAQFNIWSFVVASIVRAIIGTAVLYAIAPWKIGLGVSALAARSLLSFGIPYQANALLALLKDRLTPLVIAGMVGPLGIGYITWAQNLAFLPLEIMNIIIRVTFPAYSRLQDETEILKKAIEKSLFLTSLFLFPVLFGLVAIAPKIVLLVVNPKWAPALPLFYLFCFATFWASISTTFTNALNATGHIKITLKLMIMWTALTWLLTPVLVFWFGFIGVALTSAIISFTSIITIIVFKKLIPVNIFSNLSMPLIVSLIMAIAVFFGQRQITHVWQLFVLIIIAAIFYFALIYLLARNRLTVELKGILNAF